MRFRTKLIVIICLLIAFLFGLGGTLLVGISFQASLERQTQNALATYKMLRGTLFLVASSVGHSDYDSLTEHLAGFVGQELVDWQALALYMGEQLVYQDRRALLMSHSLPEPAADQMSYCYISDSYGQGLQMKSILKTPDEPIILEARFDLTPLYDSRRMQLKLFLGVYCGVMLLGVLIATALASGLTRKLRRLTGAVRRLAGGDLTIRSRVQGWDEVGQLSRDFDAMANRMQEDMQRMQEDMQRQEAFVGAFAHELKTPMTAIIGYADLLRQDGLDAATRRLATEYIFSEGRRLEKLSFKLLELLMMEKDVLTMRAVSLPAFLQEVERALAPRLKQQGIRLVVRSEPGRVALEPDLAKSLLYNLIDNAAKAMEGEGLIAVKGSLLPGGCQFQVVDNGRGMAQEELSRITQAFYRVDKSRSRQQGGAGIGLALCQRIVELHNGSIQFASAVGTGTRVVATLYGKES